MAVIKETKANLDGSWNKRGDKFCVGASSGHVFIATYSEDQNFWAGQQISKPLALVLIKINNNICSW